MSKSKKEKKAEQIYNHGSSARLLGTGANPAAGLLD